VSGTVREVTVRAVGAQGDGVAEGVFVPFALPNEAWRVTADAKGRAVRAQRLSDSPDRVAPECPHFGACGGCALQHWADAPYAAWKRDLLVQALARAGFADVKVAPMARTPTGGRRRADLAVDRDGRLGLHARGSARVVPIGPCPVLDPAIVALLDPLRGVLAASPALRRVVGVTVNLLDAGPDLLLAAPAPADAPTRAALAGFARAHGVLRVSWRHGAEGTEPMAVLAPPVLTLSGTPVAVPPGAFLQASRQGEAAIVAAVLAALRDLPRGPVADLFAGVGTLSLAVARQARVAAFEGSAAAAAALRSALGPRGTVAQRDLARRPLMPAELKPYAAIVLDPPFAGAAPQAAQIAAGTSRRVVYVSCNPAALARDAAILRAAGFAAVAATPVDQFLWSPHLESVVEFRR
jgi:23S rRNA (uracil1939-C5)-methyltransferase